MVPLHQVKPYDNNVKIHPTKQIESIKHSIKSFGFRQPIVIDRNNIIVAGHARYDAAVSLSIKEVPCEYADDLTEEQINAYRILDNEIAKQGTTNIEALNVELSKLPNFDFSPFNIDFPALEIISEGLTDSDEIPEITKDTKTKFGDVWILVNHRLMCEDSLNLGSIERLMKSNKANMVFTDPPYNTGMTSESQKGSGGLWKGNKSGSTRLSHMFNDSYTEDEWESFIHDFTFTLWENMQDDSVAYICMDWRRNHQLIPHLDSKFKRSNLIVWDKMVHGLGSDYKYTHEFINVCKKGKPALDTHQGDKEYSDIWHIQRKMGKNEDHATAKPVEIVERAIKHASKHDDLVLDIFGGSGTTLIACEKTRRKCFMMEISPSYCDTIINRWQKFTGKDAILESDGKTFNEVTNDRYQEKRSRKTALDSLRQ